MDIYHVWCDLRQDVSDLEFTQAVRTYLDHLKERGALAAYRITRRKLGFAPAGLGEFHISLEFDGLAHLDRAFEAVAARTDPIESFHKAVYSKAAGVTFALYRDFPDPVRGGK